MTYQLGNMISSPSAQIVNAIAEATRVTSPSGEPVPAYGPTMGVATAIIAMGIVVTTAFGPEKRGRRFESVVTGVDNSAAEKKAKDLEEGFDDERGENYEKDEKGTEERIERTERV